MSGYLGFEQNLKNNDFLQFLLSDINLNFIKKQVEHFVKDVHPKKMKIEVTKKAIRETVLNTYHKFRHVQTGDIHSRFYQCNDVFRSRLKELNDQVILFVVDYIQTQIATQHRYDGFSKWEADLISRGKSDIKMNHRVKSSVIEPRY